MIIYNYNIVDFIKFNDTLFNCDNNLILIYQKIFNYTIVINNNISLELKNLNNLFINKINEDIYNLNNGA